MNAIFILIMILALAVGFFVSINFLRWLLSKFKQEVPNFWAVCKIVVLSSLLSAVIMAIFSLVKLSNIFVGLIVSSFVFYFIFNKYQKIELKKIVGIYIIDYIFTALIVFILVFGIRFFVAQPFIVDGEAMSPTLNNNAYLLVNKLSRNIERGNVIVFRYPGNPNVSYIKRVIGLPNETIEIKDGLVFINGSKIDESYLTAQENTSGNTSTKLKDDEYFVMGDNRQHSSDSREWGILPGVNIIGKAVLPPLLSK